MTTSARITHDYVCNRTINLFATFDLASGSVIAEMCPRHRHQEFLRFLKTIDTAVPAEFNLHLVLTLRRSQNPRGRCATCPDHLERQVLVAAIEQR
ncbi:hypothetical protein ACFWUP_09290 [Nocardia sp. NPDC058658]|uniref:hypothetical protein n=1 Tax=Nocardia sp. NPDC058658 TaxID=3346580 RepID=UPI003646C05A